MDILLVVRAQKIPCSNLLRDLCVSSFLVLALKRRGLGECRVKMVKSAEFVRERPNRPPFVLVGRQASDKVVTASIVPVLRGQVTLL